MNLIQATGLGLGFSPLAWWGFGSYLKQLSLELQAHTQLVIFQMRGDECCMVMVVTDRDAGCGG